MTTSETGGCDLFVVIPPVSDGVVFGKNSDRPGDEVQEVVHFPAKDHEEGEILKCTYIRIPQARRTHAVILSRPAWMWGAEMGANEFGVCIGNAAVFTKLLEEETKEEKLLGMDLTRLALERGRTASEALQIITDLLEKHGVGGACTEEGMTYHNAFIIADHNGAWVLEMAGNLWAAEKVDGFRNISNVLSIGTKIDRHHSDLHRFAEDKGWWKKSEGDLDFAAVFTADGPNREAPRRLREGRRLLERLSSDGKFGAAEMMEILRDEESGICVQRTKGSQVSLLVGDGLASSLAACHWFTGTAFPSFSLFKPFVFVENCAVGSLTMSPADSEDRRHALWKAHEGVDAGKKEPLTSILREMETNCVKDMEDLLGHWNDKNDDAAASSATSMGKTNVKKLAEIFAHLAEMEINFYKSS